ncbi:hypothetical protein [Spirosoma utsteinense]|uniref:Outer membrane protein beta-barrel domain-containing protein n=1 Tax=Spirosoma utsteinense TaxID=2585773 RepID=A0ABR6W7Y0_9BACT|nr:hypothetical protein [Spirosoma utsteinense]MBC3783981.1 hypothetical protein [Spirosoma utsteinense]MBC3792617.1 hypothetical protein [Spirosoma utsteinense]
MRPYILISSFLLLSVNSLAQLAEPTQRTGRAKPTIYSASSGWQKVTFKPTPLIRPAPVASAAPERRAQPFSVPSQPENETRVQTSPAPARQPVSKPVNSSARAQVPPTSVPVPQPDVVAESVPAPRRIASAPNEVGYRPAFTGDFATNRNGWKAGNKGDYNYQVGLGKYNIRKRNESTTKAAFSYVSLPTEINLNIAETFTIKVDVLADSGQVPTGGILFGVADSLNYCSFSLNSLGEVSIKRVVNGETFGDYMPGDYFKAGVPLEKNRDRLMIRRIGDALHFYINEWEVRSSPYPFRMLSGTGIGLTTTAYWTSFQKLTVTLGL